MRRPDARVAVGLQFESHRSRAWTVSWPDPTCRPEEILNVVAVFVCDDVGLREGATTCAEPLTQLVVETQVDVHRVVCRAIEGADVGGGRSTTSLCLAGEKHG